jgi:hypothetical protein
MKQLARFLAFVLPIAAFADESDTRALSGKDLNPLGHTDLIQFLVALLDVVIRIGMVLLVVMFVWTGFQYVTAGGNASKVSNAHKAFMYSIIGAALVLGAFVIINVLQGTIDAVRK